MNDLRLYEVTLENSAGARIIFVALAIDEQHASNMAYNELHDWQAAMHREGMESTWCESVRELTDQTEDSNVFMLLVSE
jgi:hypothetical protein